jgi:hypothetical protein
MYKVGNDAYIEAHCRSLTGGGTTPIALKPRGDRMAVIWDNAPSEELRRCK